MPNAFEMFSPFKYFNVAPVTDWQRFINPQFNITVNQGDASVENHVLATVGSYGKQIGRMQEVLDILIAQMSPDRLTTVQSRSVEKYQELRADVVAAVEAAKPGDDTTATKQDVEIWIDRLAKLRDDDPVEFQRLAGLIGHFLASDGSARSSPKRGSR